VSIELAKITVDPNLCTGCGLCADTCPEVFELGDDGVAHVIGDSCDIHDLHQVAEDCPSGAISVED
jgi:ferredoxin